MQSSFSKLKMYVTVILIFKITISTYFAQSVVFEPIGSMDSPLPLLQLNVKEPTCIDSITFEKRFPTYVVEVSRRHFELIRREICKNLEQKKPLLNEGYPFGTYHVIFINRKCEVSEFVFLSNEESLLYFNKISLLVRDNQTLQSELKYVKARLTY